MTNGQEKLVQYLGEALAMERPRGLSGEAPLHSSVVFGG